MAYEYRKIDLGAVPIKVSDIAVLNDAGKDGWELVIIAANHCAYLRRIRAVDPAHPRTRVSSRP